jgi:hypothetical protein
LISSTCERTLALLRRRCCGQALRLSTSVRNRRKHQVRPEKLRALNPELVVPAHGRPTTVELLDETDKFYDVLLDRVGKQIAQGKSLDEIKKDPAYPSTQTGRAEKRALTRISKLLIELKK